MGECGIIVPPQGAQRGRGGGQQRIKTQVYRSRTKRPSLPCIYEERRDGDWYFQYPHARSRRPSWHFERSSSAQFFPGSGSKHKRRPSKQRSQEFNRSSSRDGRDSVDSYSSMVPDSESRKPPRPPMVNNIAPSPSGTSSSPTPAQEAQKMVIEVQDPTVCEENAKNTEKNEQAENETITTQLKYEYKEDQWSPINLEGKKEYDRDFLLKMQFEPKSMNKPEGLPALVDVVLDKPFTSSHPMGPPSRGIYPRKDGNLIDFTPGFIKSSPGTVKGMGPPMRRSQESRRGPRGGPDRQPKVITISRQQDVQLHKTENAWKPGHRAVDKPEDPDEAKNIEILKKVRSILNKLTPQKFQTLVQQVMDLDINTEDRLQGTIGIVFEKAIDEPSFSVAYANMCKVMISLKVPQKSKPGEFITFRKILLTRCQQEFEKDKDDLLDLEKMQAAIDAATTEQEKKELTEEMILAESKAKRRTLGNIRFIGELFKLKMLTENIMHDCLIKLIRSNDEESLECLCRLLSTIGKDIDHEKAKNRVDQYFQRMKKIVDEKKTSARVRFMLQDILELRANNWVPRREDNNPKTIDQIHQEVKRENEEKLYMLQNLPPVQKKTPRGPRFGNQNQPGSGSGEDGWMPVTKSRPTMIDPSKMKLSKPRMDENIQLGPGTSLGRPGFMGGWSKGSSGGSSGGFRPSSQEAERPPSAPGNRFSALSGGGQDSGYGDRDNRGRGLGRGVPPRRSDSRQGGRGGRNMARASQEQDREAALKAAKSIVGPSGGRITPGGSRNQSRESSRTREGSRNRETPQEKPAPGVKELSEVEIETKAKAILEEYLHIHDMKEAIECVKELESPSTIHFFVSNVLNNVIERSDMARKQAGNLLHDLVKHRVLTVSQYIKGLKQVLEFAEDIAIDVPKIWEYIGILMGYMSYDGTIPLAEYREPLLDLLQCNKAGAVMAYMLHHIAHNMGHIKVGDMWKSSGLNWSEFLPSNENVSEFVKDKKLEFTLGEEVRSPDSLKLPMEEIVKGLDRLIIEDNVDNEDIYDWVTSNVPESRVREPQFIRALMTAVCKSAITGNDSESYKTEETQINRRALLLQKYLDHNAELELQALYALQALVHKLHHPPGLLRQFFDTLYDEDVISEDAFNQWESSTDASEQVGKGPAKMAVVQFFTWLKEADNEPEES